MNLNLSTWNELPEVSLIQIARNCTSLQAINLSYSEGVTERAIQEILMNCKHLKKLNVSGLEQVHNMLQNSQVHVIFD